ncbi:hypothetical protein ABW21_db0208075 [Orbilia brochopaga]|nr:hypothetical protein ABW21_db0208075 [Drechslerella brochopaga]
MSSSLPSVPTAPASFLSLIAANENKPLRELVKPYLEYESKLRSLFAQDPSNPDIVDNLVGLVPIYDGHDDQIKIRSRDLSLETQEEKDRYIMPLEDERKASGQRAIVDHETFRKNFDAFTEGTLENLNWSHIVAAGSSVMTPILPVPEDDNKDEDTLRNYYNHKFAPISDIDLFIYGTKDEHVAIKRMEAVEKTIKKNLGKTDVLSVRTKNTVTIVSEFPNRHVQIVLRLYSSISEILTGFDVSCACVAYNGEQVFANPRAIVAWMLQCNDIDITRRSPSYEHRLAKYRKRGFEIYYSGLDRKIIDPTIYERNLRGSGMKGLAKILVLERLPTESERDNYLEMRRRERGRPSRMKPKRERKVLKGDWKADGAEIPDWGITANAGSEESMYETIAIPYGPRFNAERIKKHLFQTDMFLNSEWNKRVQKRRGPYLHRHPAFFGSVKYIVNDCCGYCPEPDPNNQDEVALRAKDDKYYIHGRMTFIKDDPGRQEIGSFNPITDEDWTEMAYLSINEVLCRAIVANDPEAIKTFISEGGDVNKRDHTGRTPLHLAVLASSIEIIQILLDGGARITPRLFDGRTVLHIATARGDTEICKLILLKNQQNEKEKEERDAREAQKAAATTEPTVDKDNGEDEDMSIVSKEDGSVSAHTGVSSYINIKLRKAAEDLELGEAEEEEVVRNDVLDINKADWDYQLSPLHYAIIHGHQDIVTLLVSDFGADILLPVITSYNYRGVPEAVLLPISLVFRITDPQARAPMLRTLLKLGASSSQTDLSGATGLMRVVQSGDLECLKVIFEEDSAAARAAARWTHIEYKERPSSALIVAIHQDHEEMAKLLLENGAPPEITLEMYVKACKANDQKRDRYRYYGVQPAEMALEMEMPDIFAKIIELGVDPSSYASLSIPTDRMDVGYISEYSRRYFTLLDVIDTKVKGFKNALEVIRKSQSGEEESEKTETDDEKEERESKKLKMVAIPEEYEKDSYEYWMAAQIVETENDRRKRHNDRLEPSPPRPKNDNNEDPEKVEMKRNKIEALLNRYNELADLLVSKGGKRFKELHPDIWERVFNPPKLNSPAPENFSRFGQPETETTKKPAEDEWKVSFSFTEERGKKLDPKINDAYQELYKAIWNGDKETLKRYTTTNWEENMPPLLLCVENQLEHTALSIAVLRKHPKEFLDLILSIVEAQYKRDHTNKKVPEREKIYELSEDADLYVEEFDFTEVQLTRKLGDDEEQTEQQVDAWADAAKMLNTSAPYVLGDIAQHSERGSDRLLIQAVKTGDAEFAAYMTSRIERFVGPMLTPGTYIPDRRNDNLPNIMIRNEYIDILRDFVEKYGLGAIFDGVNNFKYDDSDDEDSEESGARGPEEEVEAMETEKEEEKKPVKRPKAYPGLSIDGKKKKDWVNLMNPNWSGPPRLNYEYPPIALFAAHYGSRKVYEWLETEGPRDAIRKWQTTIEHAKDAKKSYFVKVLQAADEEKINQWMGISHPLLMHAVIKNNSVITDKDLSEDDKFKWYDDNLKFFASRNPEHLEYKKNRKGFTPLLLAASVLNKYALKSLLDLGADPYIKTPEGNYNIVHVMLKNLFNDHSYWYYSDRPRKGSWKDLRDCLALLPEDVKKWAFCHRCSDNNISSTPLAYALANLSNNPKVYKVLLENSHGNDTHASPLDIAMMEDTNGLTALELATSAWYTNSILKRESDINYPWSGFACYNGATTMSTQKVAPPVTVDEDEHNTKLRKKDWGIKHSDSEAVQRMKMLQVALMKSIEGGIGMRNLVPLRDVNERAERLANRNKSKSWFWSEGGNYDDIVNSW